MSTYTTVKDALDYINIQLIENGDPMALSFHLDILLKKPDEGYYGVASFRIQYDDRYEPEEGYPLLYKVERFRDSHITLNDLEISDIYAFLLEQIREKIPDVPANEVIAGVEIFEREYDEFEEDFYTDDGFITYNIFEPK